MNEISNIKKYVRVANYLTVAQLFLQDNFLLEKKLSFEDIKPRLLGHWGTCPGINFIYAHLDSFIRKNKTEVAFVLGPGHGFPALQANLFLEETLKEFYKKATLNEEGIGYLAKNFSWPYGFPSHSNPSAPGVILEGGELGYSLSTAYGLALDNPDLIVATVVGDGEAETAPLAGSWHLNKFINPKRDGIVLPILHLNGYKISGPTIFGRMKNKDLKSLFFGYGHDVYIVEGMNIYEKMQKTLEECYQKIKEIKKKSEKKGEDDYYRFPMIILKTPKGWTGIKKLGDDKIEDNCLAHQIPLKNAKTDKKELSMLEDWLKSYDFKELFDQKKGFTAEVKNIIPDGDYRMGKNKHTYGIDKSSRGGSTSGGKNKNNLILPDVKDFLEKISAPGASSESSMKGLGFYMGEIFKLNEEKANFRLFSPDETYSNKLDGVFESADRISMLPIKKWDKDISREGRVMEILSEHNLQGLMQGYILSGRNGVFASYEAFVQIVGSMADQYAKFLRVASEVPWRGDLPPFNYILTSSGWRQEHNGFSHQNPGFIDSMLLKHSCAVNVFFPPDANTTILVFKKCLESKNCINVIVAGKTMEPLWLTPELALKEMKEKIMIWDFASNLGSDKEEPDIVLASAGDYVTKETLAAIEIINKEAPEIKVRCVNVLDISTLRAGEEGCNAGINLDQYFTSDKPIIFNFHGYPETIKQIIFDYKGAGRFSVHGYIESGSTTTPFDMHIRNKTSRYHLVKQVFRLMKKKGVMSETKADKLIEEYKKKIKDHRDYIIKNGVDPEEIELWQWKGNI